jgi:hypothetical protein
MQRRKSFGEKILEIRGNPALLSGKNFPLFLNSHQPKYHKFKKVQNGAGITVLVLYKKKKVRQ